MNIHVIVGGVAEQRASYRWIERHAVLTLTVGRRFEVDHNGPACFTYR
jgi:hypothetical protein